MSLFTSDAMAKAKLAQCRARPGGYDLCNKYCVKLDSLTNCGRCGNKCAANQACLNGTCSAKPPTWKGYALWPGAPNVTIPAQDSFVAQYRAACGAQHRPVREDDSTSVSCLALDKRGLGFLKDNWATCGTTVGTQRVVNAPCVPRAIIKHGAPVPHADIYNTERLTPMNVTYYNTCGGNYGARPLFTDEVPAGTPACTYWTVDRPASADEMGANMAYNKACEGKTLTMACMRD
jgi:hypothetical protein